MIAFRILIVAAGLALAGTASPAWAQRGNTALADMDAGKQSFDRGDYATAVQLYSRAIATGQLAGFNLALAHSWRCNTYLAMTQFALAKVDCDRSIQLGPTVSDGYISRGGLLLLMGQHDAALADLDRAIALRADEIRRAAPAKRPPPPSGIFALRCNIHRIKKQFEKALSDCNQALALDPQARLAWVWRGDVHLEQNKLMDAATDYSRALAIDPKGLDALKGRATARYRFGAWRGAIADYTAVIALDAKDTQAYRHRGDSHAQVGEHEKAASDYGKAIELTPNDAGAYVGRARALAAQGNMAAAESDFAKAIALKPNDAEMYFARAQAYRQNEMFSRGLPDYDRAISLRADKADYYDSRGRSRFATGQFDAALADADRALQLDPKHFWALQLRSIAYRLAGRADDAMKAADALVAAHPEHWESWRQKGAAALVAGKLDEAMIAYDRAARVAPAQPFAYGARALVHTVRGDFPAAALQQRRGSALAGNAQEAAILFLLRERSGEKGFADLARSAAGFKQTTYPGTLVAFLLGNIDAAMLAASAKHEELGVVAERGCMVEYVIGSNHLIKGEKAPALERMKAAKELCRFEPLFVAAAEAEVTRLTRP